MAGSPKMVGTAKIAVQSRGNHYDADISGREIYDHFSPVVSMYGDPGDHLKFYTYALGRMFQPLDDFVKDGFEGEPGWSQVLDLQRAKDDWLPWLGQWVGYYVSTQSGIDASLWSTRERTRIISRSAHRRGTVAALIETAQDMLTSPKNVIIQERFGPVSTAHTITMSVYINQLTTSQSLFAAELQKRKAAGLILYINFLTGVEWSTLIANQATWAVVTSKFVNWSEVITNPAKP